jgi:SAM-dependent methyltransferase
LTFSGDGAARYESWYETDEGRRADEAEKAALERLLQVFPQPGSVLEVGCGTAHFTRWLADEGLAATGLDSSLEMLAAGLSSDGVRLVQGDAHSLPFMDGSFDLAAFVTSLEFLRRPRGALIEALRVARDGVLLGVLNRWSFLGVWRRLRRLFRRTSYDEARFYGVGELERLLRSVAGEGGRVVWRTAVYPRWVPWRQAQLPWGGFIGMALVVRDGADGGG